MVDGPEDIRWAPAATTPDARHASELMDLLAEAGIAARLEVVHGVGYLGSSGLSSFTVMVPEEEVPVAVGVAERLLSWFTAGSPGGASDEECIAALEEPHEEELIERVSNERERRGRTLWLVRVVLLLALVAWVAWLTSVLS